MYTLDEFEKYYIKGTGEVFFRDKIGIPKYFWPMMLLGGIAFSAALIGFMGPLQGGLLALGAFLFVTLGNLALSGYRLIVSEAGLEAYVGVMSRKISLEQIERMEIIEAGLSDYPLGKNIIRRGKGGVGYIPGLGPFRGVRIHFKNQASHYFFASNEPEQLVEALQKAMARATGDEDKTILDFEKREEATSSQVHVESVSSSHIS